MAIRFITKYLQRWRRRPRFGSPGLGLALVFFLAAALLMLLTRGFSDPAPAPRPGVEQAPPAPAPRFDPSERATPIPASDEAGGGCPKGCKVPPSDCFIKGNISLQTGERIYHLPGQQFYARTEIDPEKGEAWFCTEEEARANGWRKPRSRSPTEPARWAGSARDDSAEL